MPSLKRKQTSKSSVTSAASRKPPQKWQLQTAKAQFSEVFRRARTEGPQHVTKQGKEEVVILSKEDFDRLNQSKNRESLWDFFRNSPLAGSGIDLERRKDYPRKVEL
jgi:prevent-host-death family protein